MVSFSRCVLLAVAMAGLGGVTQAATIQTSSYVLSSQKSDCAGTPAGTPMTETTGTCTTNGDNLGSTANYCDTNYVYSLNYVGPGCDVNKVFSMTATPLKLCDYHGRREVGSYLFSNVECLDATSGNQLPMAFPPSGWAVTNEYLNRTSNRDATSCNEGGEIYKSQGAVKPGCGNAGPFPSGSAQVAMSNNHQGTILYSDANCQTIIGANIALVSCDAGMSIASLGDILRIPSNLPTQAIADYKDGDDACMGTPDFVTLYNQGTCGSGEISFSCAANQTQATVTQYNTANCTGDALGSSSYAAGTSAAPAVCVNRQRFFCSFDTSSLIDSPAPVASFSILSFTIAAAVAVFGQL